MNRDGPSPDFVGARDTHAFTGCAMRSAAEPHDLRAPVLANVTPARSYGAPSSGRTRRRSDMAGTAPRAYGRPEPIRVSRRRCARDDFSVSVQSRASWCCSSRALSRASWTRGHMLPFRLGPAPGTGQRGDTADHGQLRICRTRSVVVIRRHAVTQTLAGIHNRITWAKSSSRIQASPQLVQRQCASPWYVQGRLARRGMPACPGQNGHPKVRSISS